jgi:hypothetical protein
MEATRVEMSGFEEKLAVICPFPEPEPVGMHHPALLPAVQEEFDVTLKVVDPAGVVTSWFGGVTARVGVTPVAVNEPTMDRWMEQ